MHSVDECVHYSGIILYKWSTNPHTQMLISMCLAHVPYNPDYPTQTELKGSKKGDG
jgi:hypothetical protein